MTGMPEGPAQVVMARDGGYAYGVIGADLHVFAHGGPVYLLMEHRAGAGGAPGGAADRPSRMLDARSRVVDFTGRADDLAALTEWRDGPRGGLSAMWLHGPGGQGKSRLAAELADRSAAQGWKVVTVEHGPGAVLPPPGSQDMRTEGARGVLLIVDYADRWPPSHLNWFFNNSLLHGPLPTRVLLLARSVTMWPPVRHTLEKSLSADTRLRALPPIDAESGVGARREMFETARDCFARHYGSVDPASVPPPQGLDRPEFGLVLALHMAALVAVDARARGARAPVDMVELSSYLMDREREHWTRLHDNASAGLDFRTPPSSMHRAVFTAVLTGSVSYTDGIHLLRRVGAADPDRLLQDHATCYPPGSQGAVLEPLSPDRFAEDLLAVSLPGHPVPDHPPAMWAEATADSLVRAPEDGEPHGHSGRALTYLTAAAAPDRWPHVAAYVQALLRDEPWLAVAAGGEVLTRLADLDIPEEVLEGVERCLPEQRHIDLDSGIAALGRRLAHHRIGNTSDPAAQAREYRLLSLRAERAGLREEAVEAAEQAVALDRRAALADPGHAVELGRSLLRAAQALDEAGMWKRALEAGDEGVALLRRHGADGAEVDGREFAMALCRLADLALAEQRWGEVVALGEEAVALLRIPDTPEGRSDRGDALAYALAGLGNHLEGVGRLEEALAAKEEAAALYRDLADQAPDTYLPELAMAENNLAASYLRLRRPYEAVPLAEAVVAVERRLATTAPASFEPALASALANLSTVYWDAGRHDDAAAAGEEAAGLFGRLAQGDPDLYDERHADVLVQYARGLVHCGRYTEAVRAKAEARAIGRRRRRAAPEGRGRDPRTVAMEEAALQYQRGESWILGRHVWTPDRHWVTFLNQTEFWQDGNDNLHRLDDMSPDYCRKVEGFILRQAQGIVDVLLRTDSDEPSEWWSDDTPGSWVERKPLIAALRRRQQGRAAQLPVCHCGYEIAPGWDHSDCYPGIIVD